MVLENSLVVFQLFITDMLGFSSLRAAFSRSVVFENHLPILWLKLLHVYLSAVCEINGLEMEITLWKCTFPCEVL